MLLSSNPFIRLYEAPVESLTLAAYLLLLLSVLVATWWALTHNLIVLYKKYDSGTWTVNAPLYPPRDFVLRLAAIPVILAIDLFLLAAFVYFV